MLTRERLQELLHYDPETGVFTWRVKPSRRVRTGATAGCFDKEGYWQIKVEKRIYFAHRLAWLYVHGVWPENVIDHKNREKADNRICNLRDVTQSVNMQNQVEAMANNRSGFLGVAAPRLGKRRFAANIQVGGIQRRIGWADTAQEAHAMYMQTKRAEHVGFVPGS